MFRSIFGSNKQEVLQAARIEQFREAWLLANRSLLAIKSEAYQEERQFESENAVRDAEQWIRDAKTTFTSDAHKTEKLTHLLLPLVHEVFESVSGFRDEADVSSAHNSTTQRILEAVTRRIRSGKKLTDNETVEDLTPSESGIYHRALQIAANYWNAK